MAIRQPTVHRSLGWWALPLSFVLWAFISVYLTAQATSLYGIGLSPDSTGYVRLARDIVDHGFRFLGEKKAISQPPGYPIVLAIVSKATGRDPLDAARLLNPLMLVALIALTMLSVRKVTSFLPIVLAMGVLSCLSVPLIHVSTMAWSEPLYIMLVYFVLLLAPSCHKSIIILSILSLLCNFAFFTRYAGIVLIPLVTAYLIWFSGKTRPGRFWSGLMFWSISSLVIGLYLLRNLMLSGTLLGGRAPSQYGLVTNIDFATQTLAAWFLPWRLHTSQAAMMALSFAAGSLFFRNRRRVLLQLSDARREIAPYLGFAILHLAFIVITSTTTAYDRIDSRLLAPVYPALLVVLSLLLRPESTSRRERLICLVAVCSLVALFLASPARSVLARVAEKASYGAGGYSSATWHESELLAYVAGEPEIHEQTLFSNAPDALYILAGLDAQMSPAKAYYSSSKATGVMAENLFDGYPEFDGALLIWFDSVTRSYLYTLEELDGMCALVLIREVSDGAIFRVLTEGE